jgi:hypothetical protein
MSISGFAQCAFICHGGIAWATTRDSGLEKARLFHGCALIVRMRTSRTRSALS